MKKLILILCLIAIPVCAFAKTTFELGKDYYYKKDYKLAKYYLEREIKKNPDNYHANYFLALTYKNTSETEKAKAEFNNVLKKAPKHSMVYQYAEAAMQKYNPAPQKTNTQNAAPNPTTQTPAKQNTTPQKQTTSRQKEDLSDNYFNSSKGAYRWQQFPVKVYIGQYEHGPWVRKAFTEWQRASKNLVSFTFTTNKEEAQITVSPTNGALPTNDGGLLLGVTQSKRYAGKPYLYSADIVILRKDPKTKANIEGAVVYSVILHEAGHALGLGHSPSCSDIMATGCSRKQIAEQKLSKRDLNTLKLLYMQ